MSTNFAGTPVDTYKMASGLWDSYSKAKSEAEQRRMSEQRREMNDFQMQQAKQQQEALRQAGQQIGQGGQVNYGPLAGGLIGAGDTATGFKMLQLGEQQAAQQRQRAFAEQNSGLLSGGAAQPTYGAGKPSAGTDWDKAGQAYNYYISNGFSPHAAAAKVGSLITESNLNTGAINRGDGRDGSDSIGLGQWNGDRARGLYRFAAQNGMNPNDLNTQLAYTNYEMSNGEKRAGDALRGATDLNSAVDAAIGYERPAGWSAANPRGAHSYQKRLANAQEVARRFGSQAPSTQIAMADMPAENANPVEFRIPGEPPQIPGYDPKARTTARLGQLARVIIHPDASEQTRELARMQYQQEMEATKATPAMKEYLYARADGYQGTFSDWKKIANPGTTVNVGKGESKYDEEMGKHMAQLNVDMMKGEQSANRTIGMLDRLDQLLKDPNVYQGTGGDTFAKVKGWSKALGIDVGNMGPTEAVRAIANQFALELRNPAGGAGMPGALSDKDREFLVSMVPGLTNTREGNALLIDYMKRMNQRQLEVGRLRRDYVRQNGRLDEGFYQTLADYSAQNSLFNDMDIQGAQQALQGQALPAPTQQPQPEGAGQPARISSQQEYQQLPAGAQYIGPDGQPRTKR